MKENCNHISLFVTTMFVVVSSLSCERITQDNILYPGEETISVDTTSIRKVGETLSNSCSYKGTYLAGQGMAIRGDRMFRLFHTGICRSIVISDIDHPKVLSTFELGSHSSSNHSNCAQFDESGYLYVSSVGSIKGERGKCHVEKITEDKSALVQTITCDSVYLFSRYKGIDIICGDDGNLWAFGYNTKGDRMIFAKLKKPDLSEGGYVVLKEDDVLDYWFDDQYKYKTDVTQGGIVRGGYLFALFGTSSSNRHIAIYSIETHHKVGDLDLNSFVKEELEDCDFYDGDLVLSIYGGSGYYVMSLKRGHNRLLM